MSNKRVVEGFGPDSSDESRGAVSTGDVPKRVKGNDRRGARQTDERGTGNSKRVVRAFHDLPRSTTGPLQQDHARGERDSRQFAHTGETMTDGGVTSGRTMKGVGPYMVDAFQGRSGTPDNQNTFRGKGST